MDFTDKLQVELDALSCRIHSLKDCVDKAVELSQKRRFQKELKQLQWQALFYLEKIENSRGG